MQCQIEVPYAFRADNDNRPCYKEALHRCEDCGIPLCREHENLCCGVFWCDFCLEVHQTDEHNVPADDVYAA